MIGPLMGRNIFTQIGNRLCGDKDFVMNHGSKNAEKSIFPKLRYMSVTRETVFWRPGFDPPS